MTNPASRTLRIGTRASALALRQTEIVCDALRRAHPGIGIEVVEIRTSGEWRPEQGEKRLEELSGGKALFAKEIEESLLAGTIDCGVHSLKDLASELPHRLAVAHVLAREDPRDAFLSHVAQSLDDLPAGAVVGTTSLRRQAQILARRPDLKIQTLRGNVPTRLDKLRAGSYDAIVLAQAGLKRLGLESEAVALFDPEVMLPACGQGIIGIETRDGDTRVQALCAAIACPLTLLVAAAERSVLAAFGGTCHTPAGAFAVLEPDGRMVLRALLATPDGRSVVSCQEVSLVRTVEEAAALGRSVGRDLKARAPAGVLG